MELNNTMLPQKNRKTVVTIAILFGILILILVTGLCVYPLAKRRSTSRGEQASAYPKNQFVAESTFSEEPTKVFAWHFDDKLLNIQLINHTTRQKIKSASIQTDLPVAEAASVVKNNEVQYNGPNDAVLFTVINRQYGGDGITILDPRLDFCNAIFATDFTANKPRLVWSDKECSLITWIVDPKKPEVYVMTHDVSNNSHGTLYAINILNSQVIKKTEMSVAPSGLTLSQETGDVAFAQWLGTFHFMGTSRSFIELTKLNPYSNKGNNPFFIDETFENFQYLDDVQNISPDFRLFPYKFGYIDTQTGENFPITALAGTKLKNTKILWSADTLKILFSTEDRLIIYDRTKKTIKTMFPVDNSQTPRQWAPSQRYILFSSYSDDVKIWDNQTEKLIKLTEGFLPDGASWAY